MLKRILVLVALSLTLSLPSLAEASGSLTFNSKTFDTGLAVGSQIDDYYIVTLLDGDFESGAGRFISATLYIPAALLANGTYDLVVLKPSKESSSANACSEDTSKKFTLPSNDKVYIVLYDVSIKTTDTLVTSKGAVSTDQVSTGTVTLANISDSAFGVSVDADFEIATKVSTYSAVTPLGLSCAQTLKRSKVSYSKNAKVSDASGNFAEALVFSSDAGSADFNFKVLPNNQLIPVK